MFKIGGSAGEGITSGLVPRQGYFKGLKVSELGDLTLEQMEDIAKQRTEADKKKDLYNFMVDFGLGMVSGTPRGNVLATAAEQAQRPFQTLQNKNLKRSQIESDIFKNLFEGATKIETAKKGEGAKSYAKQWEVNRIGELMNEIAELEETDPQNKQLPILKAQLDKLKPKNPFISFFLSDEIGGKLFKKIKADLLVKDRAEGGENKYLGEDDPNLWKDATKAFEKEVSGMFNKGGRVGYQQGMSVQPQPVSMQPEMQMPEEMTSISFEELRQRLPAEVTDDIVRLIASSGEAMEDFATIETEQDIANFNKKYGVNLVLPSEG